MALDNVHEIDGHEEREDVSGVEVRELLENQA